MALQLDSVVVRVAERTLCRPIDAVLEAGSHHLVRGPSGAGKSTLLRAIAGLHPAIDGTIRLGDQSLDATAPPAWRSRVLLVGQTPARFERDVEATLRVPFAYRIRQQRAFPRERAAALLQRLGVPGLDRATRPLSGGEKQRVHLVRALLLEPQVLLLDEPTSALDGGSAAEVRAVLDEARDAGTILLEITHRDETPGVPLDITWEPPA